MIALRRGFSLLELAVASVILMALMTICLELLSAMAAQRRAIDGRQTAIRQAANVMERVCGRRYSELTPQGVREMQLAEQSPPKMPGARVEIQLVQSPDEPAAKRITVLIHREEESANSGRPIRLVAWRYRGIDD